MGVSISPAPPPPPPPVRGNRTVWNADADNGRRQTFKLIAPLHISVSSECVSAQKHKSNVTLTMEHVSKLALARRPRKHGDFVLQIAVKWRRQPTHIIIYLANRVINLLDKPARPSYYICSWFLALRLAHQIWHGWGGGRQCITPSTVRFSKNDSFILFDYFFLLSPARCIPNEW